MSQEQTVFGQILQFVSYDDFYVCVRRYDGNKGRRVQELKRVETAGKDSGNEMVVSLHVGTSQSAFVPRRLPLRLAERASAIHHRLPDRGEPSPPRTNR